MTKPISIHLDDANEDWLATGRKAAPVQRQAQGGSTCPYCHLPQGKCLCEPGGLCPGCKHEETKCVCPAGCSCAHCLLSRNASWLASLGFDQEPHKKMLRTNLEAVLANNQSRDLLRTLTEASDETDPTMDDLTVKASHARHVAQQQFMMLVDPSFFSMPLSQQVRFSWQMQHREGTQAVTALLDLCEEGASQDKMANAWTHLASKLDFWERDAVVRAVVEAGFPKAVALLKSAQTDSQVDNSWARTPGAVRHTPADQAWSGNEIPADTMGVGTTSPSDHWDQEIGYDPSVPSDELMGGDVPAIRPSASLTLREAFVMKAGGDIHPGDRISVTEDSDGLKSDDGGVCMEVQGDVCRIKFDGEPVIRWISKDMLRQETAKDDVLKDDEGGGDEGGGLGSLLGGGLELSRGLHAVADHSRTISASDLSFRDKPCCWPSSDHDSLR